MNKINQESLPEDWVLIEGDFCDTFEKELARELPKGHVLKGITVKALARRESRDDFLFYIDDIKFKYADVDLTWSEEKDPTWPITNLYVNYEKWIQEIENDEC